MRSGNIFAPRAPEISGALKQASSSATWGSPHRTKPTVTRLDGSPIAKWEVIKAIVILSSRVKAIQK